MKETVKKYIELELTALTREERPMFVSALIENIKKEGWSFDDISSLIKETEKKNLWIRQPLFEKIIYPILKSEIEKENIEAIKVLIKLEANLEAYQRKFRTNEPETWQLVERGLKINLDDRELLKRHEKILNSWLSFSIHETPNFVIFNEYEGTSINPLAKLFDELEKYKEVCNKLGLSEDEMRKELISDCELHFTNFKEYLQNQEQYPGYKEFLRRKGIL